MEAPISFTSKAIFKLNELLSTLSIPENYGIRIGIKGSKGCAGFGYLLGFDEKHKDDIEYKIEGFTIYINRGHSMYVLGMSIDFEDHGDYSGFIFLSEKEKLDR